MEIRDRNRKRFDPWAALVVCATVVGVIMGIGWLIGALTGWGSLQVTALSGLVTALIIGAVAAAVGILGGSKPDGVSNDDA